MNNTQEILKRAIARLENTYIHTQENQDMVEAIFDNLVANTVDISWDDELHLPVITSRKFFTTVY